MEEILSNSGNRHTSYSAKFFYSRVENMMGVSQRFYPSVDISACEEAGLELCKLPRSSFFNLVKVVSASLDGTIQCGAEKVLVSLSSNARDMKLSFSCQGESLEFIKLGASKGLLESLNHYAKSLGAKFAFQKTLTGIELRFLIPSI